MTRILIVEDEFIIAKSISMILSKLGYNVIGIEAEALSAIEKVKNAAPDIILMDISLAGDMDGIEAAQYIKFHYNIPVIYLTAHVDKELTDRVKITEPYGYVLKPIGSNEEKILQCFIEMALYKTMIDKKFKEQELYFQGIINNISYPIMVIGLDHKIKMMNNKAKSGLAPSYNHYSELLCYKISHHRDIPCFGKKEQCPLEYVSNTFKPITVTHEHYTRDGEVRIVEVRASPLIKDDGSFDSIIESHIEISDFKDTSWLPLYF